jgi:cysteine desulfurase
MGAAAKLAMERMAYDRDHIEMLWSAALATLGSAWTINGSTTQRYRGNLNIRREGIDVARLIADLRDLAFSLGSACASGSGRPSHVLRAIGLGDKEARSSIRLGFGRYTSEEELVAALRLIEEAVDAQERFAA